jgi:general secretion pathway protein A
MEYYKLLNFKEEPFSNSPEPEFFFPSAVHVECLQRVEMAIRLKRGLNVVVGDVGTGKTTLCRQVLRKFSEAHDASTIEMHLVMDPSFADAMEFLRVVSGMFGLPEATDISQWQYKENIKKYLFKRGVDEKKTVVLIIDEGQKLPDFCVEILREFLNYETNEHKLLQIVIFAQKEFDQTLARFVNFADRVNLYYVFRPMDFWETRSMIKFRLATASALEKPPAPFTLAALYAVYLHTGGYPRSINALCHHVLLSLIIQNKKTAGWRLVKAGAQRSLPHRAAPKTRIGFIAIAAAAAILILLSVALVQRKDLFTVSAQTKAVAPSGEGARLLEASAAPSPSSSPNEKIAEPVEPKAIEPQGKSAPDAAASSSAIKPAESASPLKPVEIAKPAKPAEIAKPSKPVETATTSKPAEPAKPEIHAKLEKPAKPENIAQPAKSETTAQTAKPEKTAEPAASDKSAASEKPGSLGALTVRSGDMVYRILRDIYNENHFSDDTYVKAILKANPRITDKNVVKVGERIIVPAITATPRTSAHASEFTWVELAKDGDINRAYETFRKYSQSFPGVKPAVMFVPHWSAGEGLKFSILLKEGFADTRSALAAVEKIPADVAKNARVIDKWEKDTVFYNSMRGGS